MNQLYCVSFSPTGTSKRAAWQIAEAFDCEKTAVDLCETADREIWAEQKDVGIFSVPCYGGRIPQTAAKRLSRLHGDETPAIVCVTFGNRAYEDALLELADCVEANGFRVIAGCAVSAEHNIMHVFGHGRPDDLDRAEIRRFSTQAVQKRKDRKMNRPSLPGNHPYKEIHLARTAVLVDEKTCTGCGFCAQECPVQAISADGRQTDEQRCINCMRCIQICPKKSRSISKEFVTALIQKLGPDCEGRKQNEFYL